MARELNLAEKTYLLDHHTEDVQVLASSLMITEEQVKQELAKIQQYQYDEQREKKTAKKAKTATKGKNASPLMNTFDKKTKHGALAMTDTASQIADELDKKNRGKHPADQRPDCVGRFHD